MIKNSKFPSCIILDINELDAVMQNNDAILAIREPKKFKLKIKEIFCTPIIASAELKEFNVFCDLVNNKIIQYLRQQKTNHINLQYLQDKRI